VPIISSIAYDCEDHPPQIVSVDVRVRTQMTGTGFYELLQLQENLLKIPILLGGFLDPGQDLGLGLPSAAHSPTHHIMMSLLDLYSCQSRICFISWLMVD